MVPRLAEAARLRAAGPLEHLVALDARDRGGQTDADFHRSSFGLTRWSKASHLQGFRSGRYWARTSDLRLVEAALSQLS